MLTSKDIREITFSNSMSGYKKDEVDILLDKIEVDYDKYEKTIEAQGAKISELEEKIKSLNEAQSSIQNVLLSAQKLADQIVEDAKAKSQQIVNEAQQNITVMTEKSRRIAEEFDARAGEKKEKLEGEISEILKNAENKKSLIESAAKESVKKQQMLFDAVKGEISAFKADIMNRYKEHLQKLSQLPDSIEVDPKTASTTIEENFGNTDIENINVNDVVDVNDEDVKENNDEKNAAPDNSDDDLQDEMINISSFTDGDE